MRQAGWPLASTVARAAACGLSIPAFLALSSQRAKSTNGSREVTTPKDIAFVLGIRSEAQGDGLTRYLDKYVTTPVFKTGNLCNREEDRPVR